MPADKDVLGKADALLRRHSASPIGVDTIPVPVLTELVDATPAASAAQAPSPDLAQAIFERVMRDVEGRLAAELERKLSQHLVPQVHIAVGSAIRELHKELASTIGDAIAKELESRHVK